MLVSAIPSDFDVSFKRKFVSEDELPSKQQKISGGLLHEHLGRTANDVNYFSKEEKNETQCEQQTKPHLGLKKNTAENVDQPSNDSDDEIDLFADDFDDSDDENPSSIAVVKDHNDWDDKEGRLRHQIGEVLNDRYKVLGYFGKGTFGNVLKVQDLIDDKNYAIKVARSHQEMKNAFDVEKEVLEKLKDIPKNFCVQLVNTFEFRKHSCLVLESMKESARDLISRVGSVSLVACKIYGNQLLRALHYVHSIGAVHADIKPDNILIGENEAVVRLCDFGTVLFDHKLDSISPEYGSLYYRAPDIILGYGVTSQIDMWSLGCTLVELFTGDILFKGTSNNNMLELFMQVAGKIPKKLIKRSVHGHVHFDIEKMKFNKEYFDDITGRYIISQKTISQQAKIDIFKNILSPVAENTMESRSSMLEFADVIQQMLTFDPQRRITPAQALHHPFFTS